MLTGRFPYPAKSPQQMMLQHVSAAPDLSPLPEGDRAAVAKALSKAPTDRFGSCLDFVRALMTGAGTAETWTQAGPVAQSRTAFRSAATPSPDFRSMPTPGPDTRSGMGLDPGQLTGRLTRPNLSMTRTAPRLTTQAQRPGLTTTRQAAAQAADDDADLIGLTAVAPARFQVRLPRIWPVIPVHRLTIPSEGPVTAPDPGALIEALVSGLCPDGRAPTAADGPARHPDGTWRVRVPVRPIPGTAAIRLAVLRDAWDAEVEQTGPDQFTVRRPHTSGGLWGRMSSKKAGLELLVHIPPPAPSWVKRPSWAGCSGRPTPRSSGPPNPSCRRCSPRPRPPSRTRTTGARRSASRPPPGSPCTPSTATARSTRRSTPGAATCPPGACAARAA